MNPLTQCRPFTDHSFLPTPSSLSSFVHLLGGVWAGKPTAQKEPATLHPVYLKPAQELETKISSLFLEKSFPVLLEFLPH